MRKWRFYFLSLVTGIILIASGFCISTIPIFSQSYTYDSDYQGFGVYSNSTIQDSKIDITLTLEPSTLYFRDTFVALKNGTYYLVFWFPFHITGIISETENMLIESKPSGTLITVEHNASLGQGTGSQETVSGTFYIDDTFSSGNKGSFAIIIPFGGYPADSLEETADNLGIRHFFKR